MKPVSDPAGAGDPAGGEATSGLRLVGELQAATTLLQKARPVVGSGTEHDISGTRDEISPSVENC